MHLLTHLSAGTFPTVIYSLLEDHIPMACHATLHCPTPAHQNLIATHNGHCSDSSSPGYSPFFNITDTPNIMSPCQRTCYLSNLKWLGYLNY